jgi:hypothetical protein
MLLEEWEQLFKLAHDDQSQQKRIEERRKALAGIFLHEIQTVAEEYRGLFALHTAYAIVLKLIAYRVVSDLKFGEPLKKFKSELRAGSSELRAFCEELEDGEIFRKLGILNLLEGDFFSWYSDKRQWNKNLAKHIGKVLHILGQYEDAAHVFSAKGAIDLFRGLYEETVPQVVRSSFGEFYTPTWLSAHVLTTAVAGSKWRMLDPCCGSGTFLVSAIEMIRKSSPNVRPGELLATIRDRVVGIDLNPLAVLTARVNYFIHICDLLPENLKNFVIPVYLGDATDIPTRVDCQGVMCCRYRLRTLEEPFEIEVALPASLCQDTARFVNTMHQYEAAIKRKDEQESAKILVNALKPAERSHSVRHQLQEMSKALVGLEERGWNGIWARIITNFLSTAMLGRFEAVVGNPPWIDWKNLPEGYRNRIKAQCIDRGLFSGAGRTGGINLNVCALIAHVSISNWLSEKGRFAFLMPRELSNQPSYEGWRNLGKEEPWVFLEFHDWSNAGHPFYPTTEDFMTYVVGNGRKQKIVPVKHYRNKTGSKKKAKGWMTVHEAMSNLRIENGVAGQVVPSSTSFTFARNMRELKQFEMVAGECEYIGREGIEFYPQELLLFRYERLGPRPYTAMLRNIQVQKSKYPIPSRLTPLETRFLFPLVKGPAIAPFVHNYDGLIVPFPYLEQDPHRPIEASRLVKMSPLLESYYNSNREVISKQTKFSDKIRGASPGEYYGLARTGPYSFRDSYVCFRDNTKWGAAVVGCHKMPWKETKRFVFQNHAVSICENKKSRRFISTQEAHYICAVLNAPIVERFIYACSDTRSFRIRPPVYLPEFDVRNTLHKKLAQLSIKAHQNTGEIDEIRRNVEAIYLKLCAKRNTRNKKT